MDPAVAVALRDGSTLTVRPVRPGDEAALVRFLAELDPEARRLRFFSAGADIRRAAASFVRQQPWLHGLVAVQGGDERIVGHAEYVIEEDAPRAEVAFEIAGELEGMGLATTLMAHLAAHAAAHGVAEFSAEVLPENHRMIDVFRGSGFHVEVGSAAGVLHVAFPTELGEAGRRRFEQRDRRMAAAAVGHVLAPASVLLVGDTTGPRSIAGALRRNLAAGGFTGPLRVSAPDGLEAVEGPVELAVLAVAGHEVVDVARRCGELGARALVVASAGFGEADAVGEAHRAALLALCRSAGIRLVGPNCLGVVNTDPAIRLQATFAPTLPEPGGVGFLTQSGGLGIAVLDRLADWGVGLSSFVSVGDKADLSGNDLLHFWQDDERTRVVVLYLQSFGNPRRFGRIARDVARHKPVVAVKAGAARAGEDDGGSTTGALLAVSDVRVEALFAQAGVIRTDTLAELLGVTALLASQPLPAGPRTAIVTNAAGPGIVCADACAAAGLRVAEGYPRDVRAGTGAAGFGAAVREALADERADAVIALFVPPLATDAGDVAGELRAARDARPRPIPLLCVFVAGDAPGAPVPLYRFPEDAARALGRAAAYAAWRRAPTGKIPAVDDARADEAAAILASALARGDGWLAGADVERLLDCYGVPRLPTVAASSVEDAARVAAGFGRPVSLKGVAAGLTGRTDAGAVELHLPDGAAVDAAARAMAGRLAAAGHAPVTFAVQPMAPPGVELLVGVAHDPRLGPVVACGAGGAVGLLLRDVAVRLAPLTDADIEAMIRGLAIHPLLEGHRGTAPADMGAIADVLARVSAMVDAHAEIAAMDLEPVVAAPEGAFVVDARVRVQAAERVADVPRVGHRPRELSRIR